MQIGRKNDTRSTWRTLKEGYKDRNTTLIFPKAKVNMNDYDIEVDPDDDYDLEVSENDDYDI